jgi:putative colanic acid biosysnthesis UDP-glucose lipid carrier transferase
MSATGPIYQRVSLLGAWYRLTDAICIALGVVIATRSGLTPVVERAVIPAAAAILVYWLLAELGGMYQSWRGVSEHREVVGTLVCWGCTSIALLILGFATKGTGEFSRKSMSVWLIVTPTLIIAGRLLTRRILYWMRSSGYNARSFAVVGVNELAFQLVRNIEASPAMGLSFAGFYDDRPDARSPEIPDNLGRRVGTLQDLIEQAKTGSIERIYITFPMRAEERIRSVLDRLGDSTASVYLVPDFFVFQLLHSRWTDILGLPVVSVFETPFYGIDGAAKRCCDLVLGGIFLLLAALPMAAIAAAVKLASQGPVFFRQRRYGLDGREIRVWKFRTMTVCEDGPQFTQATRNDPRVTPFGAWLRRSSLDELPQLFNVLGGSMSLVGPRPHVQALNDEFRPQIGGYMLRHKVKPGITGLAQINGCRGETDTPDKMQKRIEYDHSYIRDWSLWMDVKILFKTIWVVFSKNNAY